MNCKLTTRYESFYEQNTFTQEDIKNFCQNDWIIPTGGKMLYAIYDNKIVGFISFEPLEDGYVEIVVFCAKNKYCLHVGSFLLLEFEKLARYFGFIKIILIPVDEAIGFYLRNDFNWDLFDNSKMSKII